MTLDDIGQILATLEASDVTECEMTSGAHSLRVRFDRALPPMAAGDGSIGSTGIATSANAVAEAVHASGLPTTPIKATATGVLRLTHPLADTPLATGANVNAGQRVAYLDVDGVLSPVVSPVDGVILSVPAADGDWVAYGTPIADVHS
ncbi:MULTISPECIES: biotin/lipoyl-containing protein [Pandoraea]|uniref:biotin/lipoyl-containing protein n=1 Tax=Pandoraea TaxID=93217 RepID=UPI001F5CEA29|nr:MULTISPECIES: biotin/lipoyl-containing protein [Pandoraea]MCI3208734.1 hypothetical protein [Pandoraea sp. LA3]MDN4586763.1 hypothetical protein [Pandoraea capi]